MPNPDIPALIVTLQRSADSHLSSRMSPRQIQIIIDALHYTLSLEEKVQSRQNTIPSQGLVSFEAESREAKGTQNEAHPRITA